MSKKEGKSAHWHEGWLSLSFLFVLMVTAFSYPVMLSEGFGYETSIVMSLLLFIVLSVAIIIIFAGLKTDQEMRKHGIYDKARKSGNRFGARLKQSRANRKTRKAQAKGGNKEG